MLGSGKSSDNIWSVWDAHTTAGTREPRHSVSVAWTRIQNPAAAFATVGSSIVGGVDIVQGQLNIITQPNIFKYYDETERILNLNYDRQVQEPLGGMIYARGSVTFDNVTKRFTPNVSNTIGTAIKPYRPIRIFTGFQIKGQQKLVPNLYGVTEQPREDKMNRTSTVDIFDYISYINDYELESAMYEDQRSDQIISDILTDIGFSTNQFSLETGLNTIEFAWFEKGTKAGDAIRQICEAEEAQFFQDEEGLLKFQTRRSYSSNATPVWTLNKEDILEWNEDTSVPIINRCTIKAKPRAVGENTEIWRSGEILQIAAGASITVWGTFVNPVTTISTATAVTDYVANGASDNTGTDYTSSVSVSVTSFASSAKLVITNAAATAVYITFLRLRGTPAVVTTEIEEMYEDTSSTSNYGRHQLVIENDFIDTRSFAFYLARAIVRKYKDPLKRIKVRIPAMPALQVKDCVRVQDMDLNTYSNYRIMRIQGSMTPTSFYQTLTLREITDAEADAVAIVGTATVDGPAVVGS